MPSRAPIRLDRRHVYILPTGQGYVFALMLGVLLLWSINYNNSLGFGLTFLLAAVGIQNAMWRTHLNLLNLRLQPGDAEPVFVGQNARFTLRVDNPDDAARHGIALQARPGPPSYFDLPARGDALVGVEVPAPRRGILPSGRLRVMTQFPLGLFESWSWVEFDQSCLVYPRPQGAQPLPVQSSRQHGGGGIEAGHGSEDYAGLRAYVPGDSPRHVAWKASARASELLVKRFTDQSRPELWLDWDSVAVDPLEARLSQLCQWVLKAEAEGWDYGLRLPGLEIPPARGDSHRRRCLEALALYPAGGARAHG